MSFVLPRGTFLINMPLEGVALHQDSGGFISAIGSNSVGAGAGGVGLQPLASLNKLQPVGVRLVTNSNQRLLPPKNLVDIDGIQTLIAPDAVPMRREHAKQLWPYLREALAGNKRPHPEPAAWQALRSSNVRQARFLAPHIFQGSQLVWQGRSALLGELRKIVGSSYPLAQTSTNLFSQKSTLGETAYGRQILSSYLSADTVFFHTQKQANNFREVIRRVMEEKHNDLPYSRPVAFVEDGILVRDFGSKSGNRLVKPLSKPMGVEVESERLYAQTPEANREFDRLKKMTGDRKVFLINGRCEEIKNVKNMMGAYIKLVREGKTNPRDSVLVVRVSPGSGEKSYEEELEKMAMDFKAEFDHDLPALIWELRSYNDPERAALARLADVHLFVSSRNKANSSEGIEGYGTAPLSTLAVNPAALCVVGPTWLTPVTETIGEVSVLTESDSVIACMKGILEASQPEAPGERLIRVARTRRIIQESTALSWVDFVRENTLTHALPPIFRHTLNPRMGYMLWAKNQDPYPTNGRKTANPFIAR